MTNSEKRELKELELNLFCTGKYKTREEARIDAIKKFKVQKQKDIEANTKENSKNESY